MRTIFAKCLSMLVLSLVLGANAQAAEKTFKLICQNELGTTVRVNAKNVVDGYLTLTMIKYDGDTFGRVFAPLQSQRREYPNEIVFRTSWLVDLGGTVELLRLVADDEESIKLISRGEHLLCRNRNFLGN